MATKLELLESLKMVRARQVELVDRAEGENRDLAQEELNNFNAADAEIRALEGRIQRQGTLERTPMAAEERGARIEQATPNMPETGEVRTLRMTETDGYKRVFRKWLTNDVMEPQELRTLAAGRQTVTADELRAIGVGNPTGAGYLVPDEFVRSVMQNMLAYGGMREAATIMTTDSGADLFFPTSDDTGNTGELLGEHATATQQDVTVGGRSLKAMKYSSKEVRVSIELMQDSAFDIESWLAGLLGERIARITNTHFTTGAAPNQPAGVTLDAGVGVSGATGQTTSVTWDDLINLEHAVDPAYRKNARFMFNDNTLSYLRRVKDGDGNYIWQAGTSGGAPSLINGWPYTINTAMAAMAASATSILYGDFSKYVIRDVKGFSLLRLNELYSASGQVGFLGFSRHDGALIHAGTNPIQAYVNAAS